MKAEFEILADRPKVEITLTRDSVCAGDDCEAPHERRVEVYSFTNPYKFVNQFWTGYLPSVRGVGHAWTVMLNGKAIALLTTTTIEPKVSRIEFEANNAIYFVYHSATY